MEDRDGFVVDNKPVDQNLWWPNPLWLEQVWGWVEPTILLHVIHKPDLGAFKAWSYGLTNCEPLASLKLVELQNKGGAPSSNTDQEHVGRYGRDVGSSEADRVCGGQQASLDQNLAGLPPLWSCDESVVGSAGLVSVDKS